LDFFSQYTFFYSFFTIYKFLVSHFFSLFIKKLISFFLTTQQQQQHTMAPITRSQTKTMTQTQAMTQTLPPQSKYLCRDCRYIIETPEWINRQISRQMAYRFCSMFCKNKRDDAPFA
jgi:hypothetical protein